MTESEGLEKITDNRKPMNEVTFKPCPTKPDPLRRPEVLTLDLTTEQAAQFAELGECFAIVGRGSYPGHASKLCLFALPVPKAVADAACRVALGECRATKIRPKL